MTRFLLGIFLAVILVFLVVLFLPTGSTPPGEPPTTVEEDAPGTEQTQTSPDVDVDPSEQTDSPADETPATQTSPATTNETPGETPSSEMQIPAPVPTRIGMSPSPGSGAFELTLRVRTMQKSPVSGAAITWDDQSLTTGPQGEVVVPLQTLPQVVTVSHPSHQPLQVEVTADQFDATRKAVREVFLGTPGTITGRVIDNFETPVPLAEVSAQALQGVWVQKYVTNEKGLFVIDSPPDSGVRIQVSHSNYTSTEASRSEVAPPYPPEVVLTLSQDSFSISGMVVEEDSNLGVGDFDIVIESADTGHRLSKTVRSNINGMYSSGDLPRGLYRVFPAPDNRQRTGYEQTEANAVQTISLHEWSMDNVDITVSRGETLTGTVINTQGAPVGGASVFPEYNPSQTVLSTDSGHFVLNGIFASRSGAESREVTLVASHPEGGHGKATTQLATGMSADTVEIVINQDTTVSGTVVDEQGSPVPGAEIQLSVSHVPHSQTVLSDGSGTFSIQVPSPPETSTTERLEYRARVTKEGFAPLQTTISPTNSPVVLQMEFAGVIQGRVIDEQGRGVSDLSVVARSARHGNFPAQTGPDGAYRIEPIPNGVFDVFVQSDRFSGAVYQVSPNLEPVDILVRTREWIVQGPVWDEANQVAINRFTVNIQATPFSAKARPFFDQQEFHTPNGHYMLRFSIPGEYRLLFTAEGFEAQQRDVRIAPDIGDSQYIGAGLTPVETTGSIQATYVPAPGTALHGVEVIGHGAFPVMSNEFVIHDVPSGLHDVVLYIRNTETNTLFATGVLSSIAVQGGQTTSLGSLGPANINATLYPPAN